MITISDRAWIPIHHVDMKQVRKEYTHTLFDDKACDRCEYKVDRPKHPTDDSICKPCEAYKGTYKLFRKKDIRGEEHIGLPIGDLDNIKSKYNFKRIGVRDVRSKTAFKHRIKFTGSLYPSQIPAVDAMVKAGSGILEAPPRSGKTVMGTAIAVAIGKRTIIMAGQQDWLDQFYETICGGDMMGAITNIPEIEAKLGRKICGVAKTQKEFETYDIVLTTYQMFMETYGKKRMRWIRRTFGTLVVDECHGTGADQFAKVVNSMKCQHRFGLTATPDRKDTKEFLLYNIIGPVRYVVEVETLVPTVIFKESGFNKSHSTWNGALKALANNEDRNDMLVSTIIRAVKKGHHVVVPVYGIDHMKELVAKVNDEYGKNIALPFYGGLKPDVRKQTLAAARLGKKCKVIIGIRKLVQTGINVPKWSFLLECMPISNTPKLKQETYRILTPLEGKPTPIIVHILDDAPIPKACGRRTIADYKKFGFKLSKKQWQKAAPYMSRSKSYETADEDAKPVKTKYDAEPKRTTRRMF